MSRESESIQDFINKIKVHMLELKGLELPQLSKRIDGLDANLESISRHTIRSGLVGITSSGKSSLLNTLLGTGTKVLKEQSKATTNMIVFCSKSTEPRLKIFFDDKEPIEKTGPAALAESLWKYTSEDENPQNKHNVKFVKLSLPTFLLDDDIEVADTPGLDAFGHQQHEDLTLREFLPQANLIIYLSSIRSPMKEADRRILDKIMDADQRIIFVQTCKGAVVEKKFEEAGAQSIQEQLEEYKDRLKESLSHYDNLKDAPIVQVETSEAMSYFKTSDMDAWRRAGLDEFVYAVSETCAQIRAEFTLINLRRIIDEVLCVSQVMANIVKDKHEKTEALKQLSTFLVELESCKTQITLDRDKIVEEWTTQLDHAELFKKFEAEFLEIYTPRYNFNPMHDKKFLEKAAEVEKSTMLLKSLFLGTIDMERNRYKSLFREFGLDVRRSDFQQVNEYKFFLPNVQKKSIAAAIGPQECQLGEVTGEYVDKNCYLGEIENSLRLFVEPLSKHLKWWKDSIKFSFIEPLNRKIISIREDIINIEKNIPCDDAMKFRLSGIVRAMENNVREVVPVFEHGAAGRKIKAYSRYIRVIEGDSIENANIFLQLGNRLFENLFHSFYLECLNELSNNERKRIVLVGLSFEQQLGFLRRVMRLNHEMSDTVRQAELPFAINPQNKLVRMKNFSVKGELQNETTFYVLGNDKASLDAASANDLFDKADVIQVIVDDLHRVGSALRDIVERLQYYSVLRQHSKKLLLTYPAAAHFKAGKMHALVTEAIAEVDKVFLPERVHWFIYENFETRYGHFSKLSQQMLQQNLQASEMVKKWKALGLPLDDPFTESILLNQFDIVARET